MIYFMYSVWGVGVGFLSGLLGIGGGIFIIPSLVYLFGLSQHQAQGTSLAMMVPPIGLAAAYRYYNDGNIVLPIAVLGALGFFFGGYFGAGIAHHFSELVLKRVFGTIMILLGIKLWLS
jgi:hypothetical protein